MDNGHISVYPILLAGGSGTRLWPVSRENFPKQIVSFLRNESLIQTTIKRLFPAFEGDKIRVVCGKKHAHEIVRIMHAFEISAEDKIVVEPCGRNTAPAILLAILEILKHEADAVVFVFPADHLIGDVPTFHEKIAAARSLAMQDYIVTFGITPAYPETGYGYIEASDAARGEGFAIKRFVEKPDVETSENYVAAGNYFWNSGMFAFKASVMLEEFNRLKPKMIEQLQPIASGFIPLDFEHYNVVENISIDYAIMENTDKGVVLPADFRWNDIGSWKSLFDFMPKDRDGNAILSGDVILQNTRNCFIMGRERLIAVNNLEEVVIVETRDAVFVSDLENSREVKSIVNTLKERGRKEYQFHTTVSEPWGYHKLLEDTNQLNLKQVVIYSKAKMPEQILVDKPKQLLVVEGSAKVTINGESRLLEENQILQIPAKSGYKLENAGEIELHLIELLKHQSDKRGIQR
jgi:mannose-1-phosphate guanylyltransferase/mannose-6-phosphate isomerase